MRKFVSLLVTAILCSTLVFAQSKKISGVVSDVNGKPVPFASVTVKGTNNGTAADANGSYSLSNVKTGDVLVISATGYVGKEVTVGANDVLNISFSIFQLFCFN